LQNHDITWNQYGKRKKFNYHYLIKNEDLEKIKQTIKEIEEAQITTPKSKIKPDNAPITETPKFETETKQSTLTIEQKPEKENKKEEKKPEIKPKETKETTN
jgi:hypothetical protein